MSFSARDLQAAAVLLFVGLAAWIGYTHYRDSVEVQPLFTEPTGYTQIVNRGMRNKLQYVTDEPTSTPTPLLEPSGKVPAEVTDPINTAMEILAPRLSASDDLSDAERSFLVASFLLDDLDHPERFVRRPDHTPRLLGHYRRRALPFSEKAAWKGRILFREAGLRPTVTTSSGRVLQFGLRAEDPGEPIAVPFADVTEGEENTIAGTHFSWSEGVEEAFRLYAVPGPQGVPTVVLSRPQNAVGSLRQNGGITASSGSLRALSPGDWLAYQHGSVEEVLYYRIGSAGVLSDWRRGRQGPLRDSSLAQRYGLATLVRSLVNSMDRISGFVLESSQRAHAPGGVGTGRTPPAGYRELERSDLRLTLDAGIQSSAQEILNQRVHPQMGAHGWWLRDRPHTPPRAAIVVTALEGAEVLAVASYPTEEHLEEHVLRLRTAPSGYRRLADHAIFTGHRRRHALARNHAFDGHQVGSAVKPLFGAAVALTWSKQWGADPLQLTMTGTGDVGLRPRQDPVLIKGYGGDPYPMGRYKDLCVGEIDFTGFLARSCNAYMFRLGAMALEASGIPPEDCDESVGQGLAKGVRPTPATPAQASTLAPLDMYRWLTGAMSRDQETRGVYRWHTGLWGQLDADVEQLITKDLGCPLDQSTSLVDASPYRVNLDLDGLRTCHPHFSSFLKGGSTNRWNNIDFTVAFARLFTGRALKGTLLRRTADPEPTVPTDCAQSVACGDVGRFAKVRSAVAKGMAEALRTGTAASVLKRRMPSVLATFEEQTGKRWGAYAKTGSSTREARVVHGLDEKLGPLPPWKVKVRVGNFVLVLLECADDVETERAHPLACNALPVLGSRHRGYALHLWADGVPSVLGGTGTAAWLATAEGQDLLESLARFAVVNP